MPRKSKTQSTVVTSPGQPYGVSGEQKASMQTIPLPETRIEPNLQSPANNLTSQETNTDNVSVLSPAEQLMQNAQSMPAPDLNAFSAPTERPEENIMTMPSEPIKNVPNKTAEILRMVARFQNNNPTLLQKAADAERLRY